MQKYLHLLAAGALVAACTAPAPQPQTTPRDQSQPKPVSRPHITSNNSFSAVTTESDQRTFVLTEAKSYPLVDQWSYTLPDQTHRKYTEMIQIQRFKKVNAAEITDQMFGATKPIAASSRKDGTVCYVTDKGAVKEAAAWTYYDSKSGHTYGIGHMWRMPAGADFNTIEQRVLPQVCNALRNQPGISPTPLSK